MTPTSVVLNIILALFPAFLTCTVAEAATIEAVAAEIARQHNVNASSMLDEMTISTLAKADGKHITIANVIRVKRNLPASKISEFKNEMTSEILSRTCQAKALDAAFKQGMYYTYEFSSTYGELLARIKVDKLICGIK